MPTETVDRVWEGPRTKLDKFNPEHHMVQIGWWLEPEQRFVPVTESLAVGRGGIAITGSASPVYCEIGD